MNEGEKQFSFTRAASSTSGRAKNQVPISGVFVLVALLALPAYLTGEPAEDVVKALAGFSRSLIEQHEKAATVAFTGVVVLGTAALAGLLLFRAGKRVPTWFGSLMLAASLIVSVLMAWTANVGGQIRHTEIRSNASPPTVPVKKTMDR